MNSKNKVLKRGISIILATMFICISGCSKEKAVVIEPMEIEPVHSVSFDFLGGKDVMPISGYYGPYPVAASVDGQSLPDYLTDEIFEKIAECGVNMTHYAPMQINSAPEQYQKLLELGTKHNIGVFVFDGTLASFSDGEGELDLTAVSERIAQYYNYPSFCGVYVVDEPGTPYFYPSVEGAHNIDVFASTFRALKKLGIVASGNLFPVWNEGQHEKYNQYIEEYITSCNPGYLSFDHYVWDTGRTKDEYFYNIDIIRKYADEYDLPVWMYVQAGGQWNDEGNYFDSAPYFPSEGQFTWNVNTALAYGAKGIEYFTLIQPANFAYAGSTDWDFQRNGLIGAGGNKTQWWYYAQNVNKQIAAVDGVLMNSVNKGVIAAGDEAKADLAGKLYLMEGTSFRELADVQGNAMIGCFNYQGKTALYVVNYEREYKQKITLELHDAYNMSVTQGAEVTHVRTDQLTLDMKAGEGVLVVFD